MTMNITDEQQLKIEYNKGRADVIKDFEVVGETVGLDDDPVWFMIPYDEWKSFLREIGK